MASFQDAQAAYDKAYDALADIIDSDAPPAKREECRKARTKLQAEFLKKIEDQLGSADELYRGIALQMQGVIDKMGKGIGPTAAINKLTGIVKAATKALGPLDADA